MENQDRRENVYRNHFGDAQSDLLKSTENIRREYYPNNFLLIGKLATLKRDDARIIIHEFIIYKIQQGLIKDRYSLVYVLENAGFKFKRKGENYISLIGKGFKWSIRFRGTIYEREWQYKGEFNLNCEKTNNRESIEKESYHQIEKISEHYEFQSHLPIAECMNEGEYRTISLLRSVTEDYFLPYNIKLSVCPQFSLASIISSQLGNLNKIADPSLRKFAFTCSSLDAVICLDTDINSYPLLAIERQGKYHSYAHQKENDEKKRLLLEMIDLPLIWQDEPQIGKLRFFDPKEGLLCTVFPYANRGFMDLKEILHRKFNSRLKFLEPLLN